MIEDFLKAYAKKIISKPQSIDIKINNANDGICEITILVDSDDVGRLIGREGRMVSSLKTFISGVKAKNGKHYKIAIAPLGTAH